MKGSIFTKSLIVGISVIVACSVATLTEGNDLEVLYGQEETAAVPEPVVRTVTVKAPEIEPVHMEPLSHPEPATIETVEAEPDDVGTTEEDAIHEDVPQNPFPENAQIDDEMPETVAEMPETEDFCPETYEECPEDQFADDGNLDDQSGYDAELVQEQEAEAEEPELVYLGEWTTTAYCPCEICCGQWATGCTASGVPAVSNHTVACGILPFGTQVMIDGEVYTVEDTGVEGEWIDIYYDSHDDALAYGMQTKSVYLWR